MDHSIRYHQALLRDVLTNYQAHHWTVQGFGMIRTYLDDKQRWRLNVWDDRLATPNVSRIHDHPWDFESFILCGCIVNQRYFFHEAVTRTATHEYKEIVTGPDGSDVSNVKHCVLMPHEREVYVPGQTYCQERTEVHETTAERGTVTLNDRSPPSLSYTARVFWPEGYPWTPARPRTAQFHEVEAAVKAALELLR